MSHGLQQTVLFLENSDFRPQNTESYLESREKIKRLAEENTYTDHENNIKRVSIQRVSKLNLLEPSLVAWRFHNLHVYVPLQKPDFRYSYTLRDHYDSMHYPDLNLYR